MSILSRPEFHDEEAADADVEARLWPHGVMCPKCGERDRVSKMGGQSTRIGTYKCYRCRKRFTVKVRTIFESSHVKMHIWLQVIYLMCASKNGIVSDQLHWKLDVTLKTAWLMSHCIREAMRSDDSGVFGAGGGVVEVDETFIGKDRTIKPKHAKKARGYAHKHKLLSLVDRTTGRANNVVVDDLEAKKIVPVLRENIAQEAVILTDEVGQYRLLNRDFAVHGFFRHGGGEYGQGEIHTNTTKGYFSIFVRGMKGVCQHCGKRHLHPYAAEFEFRYNSMIANGSDDRVRSCQALMGVAGRHLTYGATHI